MKIILGTGQLGRVLMETILRKDKNEKILLVNRRGTLDYKIPRNVEVVAADITQSAQVHSLAVQAQVMYSCTDVPYPNWGEFYPVATQALINGLKNTEAKLVFADNMYSYGNLRGATMNETLSHTAHTKKGKIRAEVVRSFLKASREQNLKVSIVKAADFIGPRIHKGIFGLDFLKNLFAEKKIYLYGDLDLPHTFTYINDFAKAMLTVSEEADAHGQIWHVPNAPALTLRKWLALFEEKAHKKPRLSKINKSVMRVVGLFNPLISELIELSYQFEYPYLVNHQKYSKYFGEYFTTPYDIVDETIDWYKSKFKQ